MLVMKIKENAATAVSLAVMGKATLADSIFQSMRSGLSAMSFCRSSAISQAVKNPKVMHPRNTLELLTRSA